MSSAVPSQRNDPSYFTQAWRRPENQITAIVVLGVAMIVGAVTSIRHTDTVTVDFTQLMPGGASHEITLVRFLFTPEAGWMPSGSPASVVFHRRLPRRFTVGLDVWRRTGDAPSTIVLRAGDVERSVGVAPVRARRTTDFSVDHDVRTIDIVIPNDLHLGVADLVVTPLAGVGE